MVFGGERDNFRWRPARSNPIRVNEMESDHIFYSLRRVYRSTFVEFLSDETTKFIYPPTYCGQYRVNIVSPRTRNDYRNVLGRRPCLQLFCFIWELEERRGADLRGRLHDEYNQLLIDLLQSIEFTAIDIPEDPQPVEGRKINEEKIEVTIDGQEELKNLGLIAGNRRLSLQE